MSLIDKRASKSVSTPAPENEVKSKLTQQDVAFLLTRIKDGEFLGTQLTTLYTALLKLQAAYIDSQPLILQKDEIVMILSILDKQVFKVSEIEAVYSIVITLKNLI